MIYEENQCPFQDKHAYFHTNKFSHKATHTGLQTAAKSKLHDTGFTYSVGSETQLAP